MRTDARIEALRDNPFFGVLPDKELKRIVKHCELVTYAEGTTLMEQDDRGQECFVVDRGTIRVEADGVVLGSIGRGEVLGEVALLDRGKRTASAIAETRVEAWVISSREFTALLEDHPVLARRVASGLSARLRKADKSAQ